MDFEFFSITDVRQPQHSPALFFNLKKILISDISDYIYVIFLVTELDIKVIATATLTMSYLKRKTKIAQQHLK